MQRIATTDDIRRGIEALVIADPRLALVVDRAGHVPLRLREPGFASLASIVVSQQVSRASADAIFSRLVRLVDPLSAEGILAAGPRKLVEAGLSRPKQRTLMAISTAVLDDGLDLRHMCEIGTEEAIGRLTAISGIGPWTAEIYLLFAAGHPDIFPARDLALRIAVADALAIEPRPDHREVARIAESWAPWRGVAARLFWAYYREFRGRDGAPAAALNRKNE